MKILIVVDKNNSAIDRLCWSIRDYNPHLKIKILPFHPKRPSPEQIEDLYKTWEWADMIHIAYWKSGEKIKEMYPDMWIAKRKILTHHNPYDIDKQDWKEYKKVVVSNDEVLSKIPFARLIRQGIDLEQWKFNDDYTKEKVVNMVAARIEGKKGIKEVATVCRILKYKFILVGRISKKDYFDDIMKENPDTEFRHDITDEELKKAYNESAVHVCNSVDNFETGTMPILESMACGVPVITRNIGHVPDMYDGGNMIVRMKEQNDIKDLEKELQNLMENPTQREKMRQKAWETVKNRPAQKMARQFSKLYFEVMGEKKPLVSVIVPTFDRPDVLKECLVHIEEQDYPNLEIIVSDSGNTSVKPIVEKFRELSRHPVKYIQFRNHGEYTLPKARNLAVVESEGKYLLFCDERIGMEEDAVSKFQENYFDNSWMYGVKDGSEKGFVENFSFIERQDLIKYGMFNERISCYGGASQELRERFGSNGVLLTMVHEAKANALAKSGSKFGKKGDKIKAKYLLWKLYGTN